jgi:hypothetical protein
MRRGKPLPIPETEFGFTPDAFNLFGEMAGDAERKARERQEAEKAWKLAGQAQTGLFQVEQ